MPLHCVAYGCKNRQGRCDASVSFHRFPLNNPKLLMLWITSIRRKDWKPTKYSRLCSCHFTSESFTEKGPSKVKYLKKNAVPSVFNFSCHAVKCKKERRILQRCIPEVPSDDEIITNTSSGTFKEPVKNILEMNEIENLLDSPELELSSPPNCNTSDTNIIFRANNIFPTKTLQRNSFTDDFNNEVDGLKKISARESNLCEFTVFGLSVASQLQQMPLEEAHQLKEEIQNILTKSCPKSLKEPSFFLYKTQINSNGGHLL